MRGPALLLAPLLVASALLAPSAAASAVTESCELLPHGFLAGANTTGCSVSHAATRSVRAVVSVTAGTIDAIEIEIAGPSGRHVFVCTYDVFVSACALPVQESAVSGTWTVTARIVAADPLGPIFYGSADTYARLDATFE